MSADAHANLMSQVISSNGIDLNQFACQNIP